MYSETAQRYRNGGSITTDSSESCGVAQQVEKQIRSTPLASIAICFGAGIAVGCLIAASLPAHPFKREESLTERVGKSVMESLQGIVPDSILQKFSV
jgi:hypothetical protein